MRTLAHDLQSLTDHASFLSQKITFLLDATLGMITIEQSNIIKIFSIAAGVFLPPTLIASIYGMNFVHMPELDWRLGYPLAFVLMLCPPSCRGGTSSAAGGSSPATFSRATSGQSVANGALRRLTSSLPSPRPSSRGDVLRSAVASGSLGPRHSNAVPQAAADRRVRVDHGHGDEVMLHGPAVCGSRIWLKVRPCASKVPIGAARGHGRRALAR